MKKILSLWIIFFLFISPFTLLSQEDKPSTDSVFIDKDIEINIDEEQKENEIQEDEDDLLDFKEFKFRFRKESHPFLQIGSGLTNFAHKSALQKFEQQGNFYVKLGYTRSFRKFRSYLLGVKERFVSLSFNDNRFYNSITNEPNELKNYQISIGELANYGYRVGKMQMYFGSGKEYNWTKTTFDRYKIGIDTTILDFYSNAFRFGEAYNSSFTFQLFDFVGLNFNYKYGLVFPRHLFWKHLGSIMIEEVAKSLMSEYLEKVFSMRPVAGPIVIFILQSSLKYLLYELKKERMNWPFNTVKPLTYDIYSIGLKFTF